MSEPVPSPPTRVERGLIAWIRTRVAAKRPIGRSFTFGIPIDPTDRLPYFLTLWQYNPGTRTFDVFEAEVDGSSGDRDAIWSEVEAQFVDQAPGGELRFELVDVGGGRRTIEVEEDEPALLIEWGPTFELEESSSKTSPVILGRPEAPTPIATDVDGSPLLPSPEYWVVTGGTRRQFGSEDEGEVDAELEFVDNRSSKTETLDVLIVSPRASRLASFLQGIGNDPIELVELARFGLGMVDLRTIVDGSVRLATMWQQRAALSVEVSFSERSLFDARDRIIDSVEASGEVVGLPPVTITEPEP